MLLFLRYRKISGGIHFASTPTGSGKPRTRGGLEPGEDSAADIDIAQYKNKPGAGMVGPGCQRDNSPAFLEGSACEPAL